MAWTISSAWYNVLKHREGNDVPAWLHLSAWHICKSLTAFKMRGLPGKLRHLSHVSGLQLACVSVVILSRRGVAFREQATFGDCCTARLSGCKQSCPCVCIYPASSHAMMSEPEASVLSTVQSSALCMVMSHTHICNALTAAKPRFRGGSYGLFSQLQARTNLHFRSCLILHLCGVRCHNLLVSSALKCSEPDCLGPSTSSVL